MLASNLLTGYERERAAAIAERQRLSTRINVLTELITRLRTGQDEGVVAAMRQAKERTA